MWQSLQKKKEIIQCIKKIQKKKQEEKIIIEEKIKEYKRNENNDFNAFTMPNLQKVTSSIIYNHCKKFI